MNPSLQQAQERAREYLKDYECTGYQCRHETSEKHHVILEEDILNLLSQTIKEDREAIVRGGKELLRPEVCEGEKDCPWCGRNMWCRSHEEEISFNQGVESVINLINNR